MAYRSGVAMSCSVGHRHDSDLALLWLWCRPAAAAPVRPLAWELPYAAGAPLKRQNIKIKISIKCPLQDSFPFLTLSEVRRIVSWDAALYSLEIVLALNQPRQNHVMQAKLMTGL